jgi:DNA-binding response OmpR family regulator
MRRNRPRVLVVEDDEKTAATIQLYLEEAGFQATVIHDGRQGLAEARRAVYDLLVLDLMLPSMDGKEICRRIRADSDLPILMLTARTTAGDKIDGLDLGADDYMAKPFSLRELVSRVRAILRRTSQTDEPDAEPLRVGPLVMDPGKMLTSLQGEGVELTPTEFDLLWVMARRPGQVFTRERLVTEVLGADFEGQDRTIDAHIMKLRKKIEKNPVQPRIIQTVFGVGYKLMAPASESQ